MANDRLNEGEEERNGKSGSNPDDDFGLPDLEFDELEELDFNFDEESEQLAASAPVKETPKQDFMSMKESSSLHPGDLDPPASALDDGIEEVEDVLDSAQLISDRLGDLDVDDDFSGGIDYDELIGSAGLKPLEDSSDTDFMKDINFDFGSDTADDHEDLLANIDSPDDLAALGFADEDDEPKISKPSSTKTKKEPAMVRDDEDSGSSIFATNSIPSQHEQAPKFEPRPVHKLPPSYKPYDKGGAAVGGGHTRIILIGLLSITSLGFVALYFYNGFNFKSSTEEVVVAPIPEVIPPTAAEDSIARANAEAAALAEAEALKSQAATAQPGEIVVLDAATGRAYIIIGSFVDSDLAMDFAKILSTKGKGVKILNPIGNAKRYRVSIADFAAFTDAGSQLSSFQTEYGADVWALRY